VLRGKSTSFFLETSDPEFLPKLLQENAEFLVFSAFTTGKFHFKLSSSG
jgi:hypothetical protein